MDQLTKKEAAAASPGSAGASRALSGASPESPEEVRYSKRRLPHFERPWAKYAIAFSAHQRRVLTPEERTIVLRSTCYGHEKLQYEPYVACMMPDHVHLLLEPQIKDLSENSESIFWPLAEILHGIKSSTAHRIAKLRGEHGTVWDKESFHRLIRSGSDPEEKFSYICRNRWDSGLVDANADYPWLWTQEMSSAAAPKTARELRAGVALRALPNL